MALKFHEYLARRDGINLEEAARRSLAETWRLAETSKVLGLMAATRGENACEVNLARNQQLAHDLRAYGFGLIPLVGTCVRRVRDPKTGQEGGQEHVEETAFLVSMPDDIPEARVRNLLLPLVQRYGQEAAVLKYGASEDALLLRHDGSQVSLGKWSKERLAEFFVRMKYGEDDPDRSFGFQYADDLTRSTRMAMDYFGRE